MRQNASVWSESEKCLLVSFVGQSCWGLFREELRTIISLFHLIWKFSGDSFLDNLDENLSPVAEINVR